MAQVETAQTGSGSRVLLKALRDVLAEAGDGQARLDKIVRLVAGQMVAEVCSIYLKRDARTLELCATEGLAPEAVHSVTMKVGSGLVGRIAERAEPIATDDARSAPGFQYIPETREEIYRSFAGVPIQRLGEIMGVLVVQNEVARIYSEDEIDGLEIVAMVIAEMAESGVFASSTAETRAIPERRIQQVDIIGLPVSEGLAEGPVHLHEPRVLVFNPIADNADGERVRLREAMEALRDEIDGLVESKVLGPSGEHRDVLEAYRMFAYDKGWMRRLEEAIDQGLAAEVAVEKVQSAARARMERVAEPYMRERLHDLDDLANRLLRHLLGAAGRPEIDEGAILIARNIGPGDLMDHAGRIAGLVLEEGSISSHAAIVARALAIPMVVQCAKLEREANQGDKIVVDGTLGSVSLRPGADVLEIFQEKMHAAKEAAELHRALRDLPAETVDGTRVKLQMNAGLLADLPSLERSGAEGVGLFRTELQFMLRARLPRREAQAAIYRRIMDAAKGQQVTFRTLDIGSDKILPYMKRATEPNPALGWRALRVGLDRPLLFRMQLEALMIGADGRPLTLMFPMVTEAAEFDAARRLVDASAAKLAERGAQLPEKIRVGAMLETPALAYAPESFFKRVDFLSVGGNDLHQFFFAADRENERVRRRYDTLSHSFLGFLRQIVDLSARADTPLSYCGEAAGRPLEAAVLVALGFRNLSMRPASIGPVKRFLRSIDLSELRHEIAASGAAGERSARTRLSAWAAATGPFL